MNIYESLHFELCSPMFPTLWHELLENYTYWGRHHDIHLWKSRILWKAGLAVYDTSYRTGLNCAVQCCATVNQSFWRKEKPRNPFWSEKMRWFSSLFTNTLIYRNLLKLDLQFQDVKQRNLWPNSKGPCCLTRIMSPQVAENTSISLTGTWGKTCMSCSNEYF